MQEARAQALRSRVAVTPSARQITAAVADAAERWCDADFPARVRATAAIRARTSYTEPVVDFALDALFGSLDRRSLEGTIASELGSLAALDGFVARDGRPDVRYVARGPVAIVASDSTIGVAIPAFAFALCAKADVRVKDRDDALTAAFAETVADEQPALRERMRVASWQASDETAAGEFFSGAGTVVAYGRDATLTSIRNRLAAATAFAGYGHRTSVAYVARETLALPERERDEIAFALARDVLLYDGDGCLSPHVVFVEEGGPLGPAEFAREFARALDAAAVEFPAGYAAPPPATVAFRNAALFRAAQGGGAVYSGARDPYVLAFDPAGGPPPLHPRAVAIVPASRPADVVRYALDHTLPLEAVAASASRPDIEVAAIAAGAVRIAAPGELQRPPLGGDHGGNGRILPMLRAIYRA